MSLVVQHGRVIDPANGIDAHLDVLIDEGKIAQVGAGLRGERAIDATGSVVCPGFVDLHAHFREPGFESKETIASGALAAAHGGFTSVVTMPDTKPPIDNAGMLEFIHRRARETACVRICPAAAATKARQGQEMTEMAELRDVGAVAVTDADQDIDSSWVLRRVLEYARMVGLPFLAHCDDVSLQDSGHMNEGYNSTRLGIPGMPAAMQEVRIDRAIRLARLTGAHVHIQCVSTAEGVRLVREAKAEGLRVTAETSPHYFMLTDAAVEIYGPNAKVNPPLRTDDDVQAVKDGLREGIIDAIATDHSPHTFTEKDVEFQLAPFGLMGLETALPSTLSALVEPGLLALSDAIALLTCKPARVIGLNAGTLAVGAAADVTVFKADAEYALQPSLIKSRSKNSPYTGTTLRGKVTHTICDGAVVYEAK
ncbi:MAG: dihydroorotase [Candidatus Hydrogenedentota bacterium]